MNKIIVKSVKIAQDIFPSTYNQKQKYRTFHFSFGWKKNTLLAIGQNRPYVPNGKAMKFARKFNTPKTIKYPYLHSEVDMISKLWGKIHIDNTLKVVVIRLNKFNQLCNSKPCQSCLTVLNALDISEIWWSDISGSITNGQICNFLEKET